MSGYASLESQLGSEVCPVTDTEEMYWLSRADDYQSQVALGTMRSAQYRFKDALAAFRLAERIRDDDPLLHLRLGGALLTLRRIGEARKAYDRCAALGMDEKKLAFYFGFCDYLEKDYGHAASRFARALPCDDAETVSTVYWHSLCDLRLGRELSLLSHIREDMQAGHHAAYLSAVSVFAGKKTVEDALLALDREQIDLDSVILAYGLSVLLESRGRAAEAGALRERLLEKQSVWPCTAYLAAWGERGAGNDP